ncbi:hypothetical protein [Terriglobus tenax]|uniref:hypothetical protein n=1 Tax=Terriglobus tenax TaxID=1111115 RepID=UPI0021DF52D4|nr:hypothetical protein [Terriglobus tenax]
MKVFLFVLAATVFEAVGDAVIRIAVHTGNMRARVMFFLLGSLLLTAYGTCLNIAPVEFATVVGLYIALLFIVFQITNYLFFDVAPTIPVLLGGVLILSGSAIVYLWRPVVE